MNELVRLTTQDVSKAIPVTDSLIVAERLEVPHYYITRLIKRHEEDFKEFGAIDFESRLLTSKNVDVILLSEAQFLLLITYLRATKKKTKVIEIKKLFVRNFMALKNELQARTQTRILSKEVRKSLTDTIRDNVREGGNFKKYVYGHYSKLVYKKLFGKDVKKLKAEKKCPEKGNIRDYFNLEEIEKIQELESKIAHYIEMRSKGTTDKEVYAEVKEYIEQTLAEEKNS